MTKAMAAIERLMTAKEVSDHLGIPLQTLYVWRVDGKGPAATRVGKHLRFTRASVDAWITNQTESR